MKSRQDTLKEVDMRNVLAVMALLLAMVIVFGGGQELSAEEVSTSGPDLLVLVRPQTVPPCTYLTLDTGEEREGTWVGITSRVVPTAAKFSEQSACQVAPPCQEPSCFLQGEYFFRAKVERLAFDSDCVSWRMGGARRGVWYGRVGDRIIPPTYSDPSAMAVEKICGVVASDVVEVAWMACPDIAGPRGELDNKVDLMSDIFGVAYAYGTSEGDPFWNILADTDRSGSIDLMNDIFSVIWHWNLNCDDFPLVEE